jgi:hypothetical protein
MVDKKNLFETKNANLTKNAKHFLFQKGFFCQPFFEKTQTLHFLFQKGFFCQPFIEKIQGFPKENLCPFLFYGTGAENLCPFLVSLPCPFSPLFPEKGQGRDTRLENLCPYLFTPFPRKGAGKGYQVWTLQSLEQSIIFHTF